MGRRSVRPRAALTDRRLVSDVLRELSSFHGVPSRRALVFSPQSPCPQEPLHVLLPPPAALWSSLCRVLAADTALFLRPPTALHPALLRPPTGAPATGALSMAAARSVTRPCGNRGDTVAVGTGRGWGGRGTGPGVRRYRRWHAYHPTRHGRRRRTRD